MGRRAAALEVAAVMPKDEARGVVLGAVLNLSLPNVAPELPADAAVLGSEPALVEAFTRAADWLGDHDLRVRAESIGSWWKIHLSVSSPRAPMPTPEMGEPLVRLIVDAHLEGWLDTDVADGVDVYLPAYRPR